MKTYPERQHCPLCESNSEHHAPAPGWGEVRRCLSCGFLFVSLHRPPYEPTELFTAAYEGKYQAEPGADEMKDLAYRLSIRSDAKWSRIAPERLLLGAHLEALDFICSNFPPGSAVLDIGCGVGYFLDALRKRGYKAYGLDVAKPVVEALQKEGYPVWFGEVSTIPAGWVEPQVCTCFFVLHHLYDPVGFLRTIKAKFPSTPLIISDNNGIQLGVQLLPPRTYCQWDAKTLHLAMQRAGYNSKVWEVRRKGRDAFPVMGQGMIYNFIRQISPSIARLIVALFFRLLPLMIRHRHLPKPLSVIAIGYPVEEQGGEGGN